MLPKKFWLYFLIKKHFKMKTLELNQMENLEGGDFNWRACASGGGTLAWAYANSPAAIFGGLWGLAAAAAVGCVASGLALSSAA